jgi:phosphoglucomutase/phosphomannomutase
VAPLKVVLAYDVRQFEDKNRHYHPTLPNPVLHLSSKDFARHAAGIYVANGIHAYLLPEQSPRYLATPELSFLIRHLRAHGGLNISASHNPPDDNGGKFYNERGGQTVPPDDQIMADLVDQVKAIKSLAWPDALRSGKIHPIEESAHQAYIDLICKQSLVGPPRFDEFQVVFTPLHGVGHLTAMEALVKQGFRVQGVAEQMQPDGQFPNVTKSPNPEVPESMDKAEALARSIGADLVLATDPDADRLGAMIPGVRGQESEDGRWRFVTGNEIVALLTYFKLSKLSAQGSLPESPIVIKTAVTTSLVTRIARQFGCQVVEDLLVGFKYIAEVLWQLEQTGSYEEVRGQPGDFIIGCEESHGVLVTPAIRDKDAAGGALLLAELALDLKRQGQTMLSCLDDLYRRFGYCHNSVANLVMPGIEGKQNMLRMLDRLRRGPPREIAGLAVTAFEDWRDEQGRFGPLKGATDAASRNVLLFRLGEQARVALRPSGTEPKAKAYVEVCSPPCRPGMSADAWSGSCREVDDLARRLAKEFVALASSSH